MLLPDPTTFDDRRQFPIFDPAEEAAFSKVTFLQARWRIRKRMVLNNTLEVRYYILRVTA
jgi:hypothetical protein